MEFTKEESKMLKGIAILFMVGLHLFNRTDPTGYYHAWIYIRGVPLVYYISFLFDACVPIYCFCSGYAFYLKQAVSIKENIRRFLNLLIHYWIIVILTCVVGWLTHSSNIRGGIQDFLGTMFLYDIHYVGAWWFMQIYLLLVLTTPFLIRAIDYQHPFVTLCEVGMIYVVSYYFRMIHPVNSKIISALVLYGTSLLPFILGMLCYKYRLVTKIRHLGKVIGHENVLGIMFILGAAGLHAVIKTMAIAPITAMIVIIGFALCRMNGYVRQFFLFFGDHSTNIWLVHMQFYSIFCSKFVFSTQTVIGALLICLGLSLIASYLIRWLKQMIEQCVPLLQKSL